MIRDLTQIDPEWAWSPYEPGAKQPWDRRLAAHLFRRAGFAASWTELDAAAKSSPREVVDRICSPVGDRAGEFEQMATALSERALAAGNLPAVWLYRMLNGPDPLLEKLTLFWHGHFATSLAKVGKARLMLDQNELFRTQAKGRFGQMVKAVSRDPAMLIYLDSTTNRRIRPNENYARELMELFCLGVGNYTEEDIKEVARCFTGWEVLGDDFRFNASQHDTKSKHFFGAAGDFDGDDAVRIVLNQPAAPRFIARKLIRFFVFDEPTAPERLVEPIAAALRTGDFEIGPVVHQVLGSNLFFSEYAIGRKVRSPVELGVGLLRALQASTNLVRLAQALSDSGQGLFFPPNVKGWEGGRTWINSAALLGRANLVRQTLLASETNFEKAGGSLATAAERSGATTSDSILDWLLDLLVAMPIPAEARAALMDLLDSRDGPTDRNRRIIDVVIALGAMPEFQVC